MSTEVQEQTATDAAKATLAQTQETHKTAKTELTAARKVVREREKAANGTEGDAKIAADAAVAEAKDALAQASSRVDQVAAEVKTARDAVKAAREVDKVARAEERKNQPKKASMTLSQRRALLKLGDGPITPHTAFNQLPLQYLVSVGLAQVEVVKVPEEYQETVEQTETVGEGDDAKEVTTKVKETRTREIERNQYSLSEAGQARVGEINPKWKTWRSPSAVTGDNVGVADTGTNGAATATEDSGSATA